jgi:hypothetical protein
MTLEMPSLQTTTTVDVDVDVPVSSKNKNVWRCDVCQVQCFDKFEDACRHEDECKLERAAQQRQQSECQSESQCPQTAAPQLPSAHPLQQRPENNAAAATKTETTKTASTSTTASATSTISKKQPISPEASPQPPASATSKKCKKAVPTNAAVKKHVTSFFAPRKVAKRAAESTAESTAESKPKVAPSSFFAPLPKKAKTDATVPTNQSQNTKQPKEAIHVETVGMARRRTKEQIIDLDEDDSDEVEVVKVKTTKKAKRNPQKEKTVTASTIQDAEATANALAAMIAEESNRSTPIANIFSSKSTKALMAEQRQAEFQAKRRMERQKELERQEKRRAAGPSSPARKTAAGAASKSTTGRSTIKALHLLATKFPVPSHVMPSKSNLEESALVTIPDEPSCHWVDIPKTPLTPVQPSQVPGQPNDDNYTPLKKLVSSPSALDSTVDTRDLMYEALANLLAPGGRRTTNTTKDEDDARLLWSDKYGMHHSGLVIGERTQQAAHTLQAWINEWRTARQAAMDRMAERQRKLGKKKKQARKIIYKNDDDLWGDEDEAQLCNVYVLTGPAASGKTALVHHVARHCDCRVLEINTTAPRNGTALKHAIQEATQSCSSLDMLKHQQQQQQTQQQQNNLVERTIKANALSDSEDEDEPQAPTSSLTVILIDEVDIVFESEGDAGFWTALTSLAKTAKCPIFLTANQVPFELKKSSMHYKHLELHRPTTTECATQLLQVCQHQGMKLLQNDAGPDPDAIHARLAWIANVCDCDLRRMLQELQWFAHQHNGKTSQPDNNNKQQRIPSDEGKPMDNSNSEESHVGNHSRPTIGSLVPHRVPAHKYSLVTVHGKNLNVWKATDDLKVSIGGQLCPTRLVDDHRLLVLCPPCTGSSSLEARIATISIQSNNSSRMLLDGRSMDKQELADGNVLFNSSHLYIEYMVPQDEEQAECEFEAGSSNEGTNDPSRCQGLLEEQGMILWKDALSELETSHSKPSLLDPSRTSSKDCEMQETLESLSEDALWASDAALLEDLQHGVPYLTGACRGFAFDLTEDGGEPPKGGGKLRMNENSRPPREERLFTLGWKDNCYFFGDSDTYMTMPSTARERRELHAWMATSRGDCLSGRDGGVNAPAEQEDEELDDLEDIIRRECAISDEDMFLPRPVPTLIESLPSLLRQSRKCSSYQQNWTSNQVLDRKQIQSSVAMQQWVSYVFGETGQGKVFSRRTSQELLLLNGTMDASVSLEFLPTLRRICVMERAAECLETKTGDQPVTGRRTTRRQALARRHHYFDAHSKKLRLDEADLTSSELGSLMADALLIYDKFQ